ncbi:MAG: class I tRNA ligase family protein, partial [Candidatus Sericytochromatia bacterium]
MEPTKQGTTTPERDYKQTLNLPQTDFPMKANSAAREPAFQARWEAQGLYGKVLAKRQGAKTFMLHDGPPYLSSPNIHIGHALNRVLKDIVVKHRGLSGHYAPFVPGYDCHGLPIENAVLKNVQGGRHAMGVLELRGKCKDFAEHNLEGQQARFRRLGILADWEHPYLTMDPAFEAKQISIFGEMAQKGYIYRGLKPVYWCPNCETALAEAEVEYDTHHSPSIYVKFQLKFNSQAMVAKLAKITEPIFFVIWTTTPWTLPANVALSVHPQFKYVVLKTDKHGYLVVAEELKDRFLAETGLEGKVVETFVGGEFEMLQADHPFLPFRTSLVILGEHVTAEAGTGIVHTAPGHGLEDYEVGKKYKLPVIAPVNA